MAESPSKWLENTVEKGEIVHYDQFFPFSSVYKRSELQTCKKQGLFGKGLTDDKILGLPKFKTFADDISNVTQNIKVVFHTIENIVGKKENAGYQHFLPFPQCFQKAFYSSVSKVVICGNRLTKQHIFRHVKFESIYKRHNKCNSKTEILSGMCKKKTV